MKCVRILTTFALFITVAVLVVTAMPYWFGETQLPSYLRGVLQNSSSSVLDKRLTPTRTKIRRVQLATIWDPSYVNEPSIYRFTYRIVNAFLHDSVPIYLFSGSVLGARRHHGVVPFDKDVDFALFSTNTTYIEHVLGTLNIKWSYNTDGKGPGNTGFGYHLYTPFKHYVDIWLFDYVHDGQKVTCVGVRNGCKPSVSVFPGKWAYFAQCLM